MGSVKYCMSRLLATGNYLPAAMMNSGSGDSAVTRLGVQAQGKQKASVP